MKQIAFWDENAQRPVYLMVPALLLVQPVDTQALDDYRLAHRAEWQAFNNA